MLNKNFKILFIYPNTMMATLVPINISQLYACLKNKGFEVSLFDTTYYKTEDISFEEKKAQLLQVKEFNWEEKGVYFKKTDIFADLKNKINEYKPDLIAITIVEDTWDLSKKLLEVAGKFDMPVIAGGVFVTFSPEKVIENDVIDIVCIGEGEEALIELCNKLSEGKDYSGIKNLWVKKNNNIKKNPMRPLIDINNLPYIEYDIFDKERLYRPMYGKIYTMVHIEIDRGCPYSCTYCEAPALKKIHANAGFNNYYRKKKARRVYDELSYLSKKYNPDYINFNSEAFLGRTVSELKEFADFYKKIKIPFWCQTRPESVIEEKIKILKEMNCQNLQFGVEHGNEEFRKKVLNRTGTNTKIIEALKIVEKYGIKYTVNNIIGFPGETRELVFDTIDLNRQINPATINCYMFTPYKGTVLRKYCVENGYLVEEAKVHQLLDGAPFMKNTITYQELKGLQRTFPLYCKMPESEWSRIRKAEEFTEEGNNTFKELRKIYYERYFI